jgi:hypothetical protein
MLAGELALAGQTAYAALIDGLNAELADWIATSAPARAQDDRAVLAAPGVNTTARHSRPAYQELSLCLPGRIWLEQQNC